jgi:mannitol/fructose-specific phosphotransferase system IIA component (Ntr-type)
MLSGDHIDSSRVRFLSSSNKFLAIEELAQVFSHSDVCSDTEELVRTLKEREEIMSTGIGFGIAIPHVKNSVINRIGFAVGVSRAGINFDSMDGEPVHLVILIVAGEKEQKEYLGLLSRIMGLLKNPGVKDRIISSTKVEEIVGIIESYKTK